MITQYKTKLTKDKKVKLENERMIECSEEERRITNPDKVDNIARNYLRIHEESEEYAYMLCLNTKNVVTSVFELSHGNVNSSIVGIREMYQKALLANAVSVIVFHNHPSGDCKPSIEDIKISKRMIEAGNIIGVEFLDHLVIGETRYCSLKSEGHI